MRPTSHLLASACSRPSKLFRYSQRSWLERSLQLGEFHLRPTAQGRADTSEQILPFSVRRSAPPANYLALSWSNAWDEKLFDTFTDADCCLIVHNTEDFGERIHRAVQRALPSWAGIDAAISYGKPSPLGSVFSKDRLHAPEKEWLFAWRPTTPELLAHPLVIRIGSIEQIAELRQKTA